MTALRRHIRTLNGDRLTYSGGLEDDLVHHLGDGLRSALKHNALNQTSRLVDSLGGHRYGDTDTLGVGTEQTDGDVGIAKGNAFTYEGSLYGLDDWPLVVTFQTGAEWNANHLVKGLGIEGLHDSLCRQLDAVDTGGTVHKHVSCGLSTALDGELETLALLQSLAHLCVDVLCLFQAAHGGSCLVGVDLHLKDVELTHQLLYLCLFSIGRFTLFGFHCISNLTEASLDF